LVPVNDKPLIIDLIVKFQADVILIVQRYLGSLNHSLLSFELLKAKNLNLKGIILNGIEDEYSERAIQNFSNVTVLKRVKNMNICYKESISTEGNSLILV